jgi:branched-chain amino acid transport system permease protein
MAAIASGAAFAVLTNSLLVRPLLVRGRAVVMLGTLGLSIAIQSSIALVFGSRLRVSTVEEFTLSDRLPLYPREIGVFAVALGTAWIMHNVLRRTPLGIRLRAMVSSYENAVVLGVPANQMYNLVFLVAGALAGFGGCVLAIASGVFPTAGFHWMIYGFTAAVVGGLGSLWGAVVGGLAMGVVVAFTEAWGGALLAEAAMLAVITGFLIFRPVGLLGKRLRSY